MCQCLSICTSKAWEHRGHVEVFREVRLCVKSSLLQSSLQLPAPPPARNSNMNHRSIQRQLLDGKQQPRCGLCVPERVPCTTRLQTEEILQVQSEGGGGGVGNRQKAGEVPLGNRQVLSLPEVPGKGGAVGASRGYCRGFVCRAVDSYSYLWAVISQLILCEAILHPTAAGPCPSL